MLPPAVALAAAACATWISIQRVPRWLSWPELFLTAFHLCFAAATVAALGAFVAQRLIPQRAGLPVEQAVQRAAISGLWLPPLLILIRRESLWALLPALLLALTVHRLFSRPALGGFAPSSWMLHSVALAVLAQATVVTAISGRLEIACLALGAGTLMLWERTWRPLRKPPELRRSLTPSPRVLAMVTAAALLTVGGLTQFLRAGFGFGEGNWIAKLFGDNGFLRERSQRSPGRNPRKFTSDDLSPSHKAIILWPEQKSGVIGLIPPLPQMGPTLAGKKREQSVVIPFYGVYWLLRPPDRAPPPDAITMRGNPAYQGFRSNDSVPLSMEAWQHLTVLVNTSCCEAIQVSIFNADTYEDTIRMELLVRNTTLPGKPVVSLGTIPIKSAAKFRFSGPGRVAPGIVAEETLTFPVSAHMALQQFDEFWVRFETARLRSDRSPRISIESFRLIPRRG